MSGQDQADIRANGGGGQSGKPTRRQHTIQEKLQIVQESFAGDVSVAGVALAHAINVNQVFKWRRLYRQGLLRERRHLVARLLPVQIAETAAEQVAIADSAECAVSSFEHGNTPSGLRPNSAPGTIHIQLPNAQLRIEGAADAATLRAVLEMLR